jgi:hypothetical protein
MHHAMTIGRAPMESWAARIAELPEQCAHADCGAPRSCRERIKDYMRDQWRIRKQLSSQQQQAKT